MACEQCGKTKPVMLAMTPGEDGKAWEVCSGCYLQGLRPMDWDTKQAKQTPVLEVTPEMAEALKKSGWNVASEEETRKRGTKKPGSAKRRAAGG